MRGFVLVLCLASCGPPQLIQNGTYRLHHSNAANLTTGETLECDAVGDFAITTKWRGGGEYDVTMQGVGTLCGEPLRCTLQRVRWTIDASATIVARQTLEESCNGPPPAGNEVYRRIDLVGNGFTQEWKTTSGGNTYVISWTFLNY